MENNDSSFKDPSRNWPWIIMVCTALGIYLYYFTESKNLHKTGFISLVMAYVLSYSSIQKPAVLKSPKALSLFIDVVALLAFILTIAGIKIYFEK